MAVSMVPAWAGEAAPLAGLTPVKPSAAIVAPVVVAARMRAIRRYTARSLLPVNPPAAAPCAIPAGPEALCGFGQATMHRPGTGAKGPLSAGPWPFVAPCAVQQAGHRERLLAPAVQEAGYGPRVSRTARSRSA